MIAPDRSASQRLRRRVRQLVNASPALRRERKSRRLPWHRRRLAPAILRGLIPLAGFGGLFFGLPREQVLGLLIGWSLAVLLNRATQFTRLLGDPNFLVPLFWLPTDQREVFDRQWRQVQRASWWLAIDWFAFGLADFLRAPSLAGVFAVPLLAIAQGLVALAVAAFAARRWPRAPYPLGITVACVLLYATMFLSKAQGGAAWARHLWQAMDVATPAGWLASAYASASSGGALGWAVLAGFTGGGAALLRFVRNRWRADFSLERIFHYADDEKDTDGLASTAEKPVEEPRAEGERSIPPADFASVRQALRRELEQPAGLALFRRGPMERMATRLLSARQRVLVDFLCPHGRVSWGRGWLIALMLILAASGWNAQGGWLAVSQILVGCALGFVATPALGGNWLGFTPIGLIGLIGLNSFYPVGFWEIARLRGWLALLRTVAALPLLLFAARFAFTAQPLPWNEAVAWAARGALLLVAVQPLWIVASFSKNSADSHLPFRHVLWVLPLLVLALILVVAASVTFLAADSLGAVGPAGALLLIAMYMGLLFYGWAYNRSWFDLIHRPRQ